MLGEGFRLRISRREGLSVRCDSSVTSVRSPATCKGNLNAARAGHRIFID